MKTNGTGKNEDAILGEYGFWDYTTPAAGSMEQYAKEDYILLLDDMAGAGMNSLVVMMKWLTTGYRSSLSFLDQLPGNLTIDSDNELLRGVISEAGKRGIKTWLGGALTHYGIETFGLTPHTRLDVVDDFQLPMPVGIYSPDLPGVAERIVRICEELVELFPEAGGLIVELEDADVYQPHRRALYNAWAEANGRASYEQLMADFRLRSKHANDVPEWRDYTTQSRIDVLDAVEKAVRSKGFSGDLATICECALAPFVVSCGINITEFHRQLPQWMAITFHYEKSRYRHALMDLCIDTPKREGLTVLYLPRGVSTLPVWPMPISLEQSWQMDVEDVLKYRPHGVWWFASGASSEGIHTSPSKLREAGFTSGLQARRKLLEVASQLCVAR